MRIAVTTLLNNIVAISTISDSVYTYYVFKVEIAPPDTIPEISITIT